MCRRRAPLIVSAFCLALVVGCVESSDAIASDPQLPVDAGPVTTLAPVPPDPLQAEIMDDGDVTPSEMERALLAVVACVNSAGFDAELTEFSAADGYSFRTHNDASQNEAASQALDRCRQMYLSQIEEPFRRQHGPTQEDIIAEQQEKRRCLLERGYDAEVLDSPDALDHVEMDDLIACDPDTR